MSNEILFFITIIVNFGGMMTAYRLWGKYGLFVWVAMGTIIANIEVLKTVSLFGLTATLGNVIYATTFLATDILSENHGKEDARQAVWIGFFSLITMTALMQLALLFTPHQDDFAHGALATIFGFMPRLAFASLAAYFVAQFHDVWAYHFWWKLFPNQLWLRNNGSTLLSQLLDTSVFVLLAFWGELPPAMIWQIALSTYLLKVLAAVCDTPFLYLARWLKDRGHVPADFGVEA